METNRIKQFCVIAETGSLTKAAKLLYITHSGLSKSMQLLQTSLGQKLFRPIGRGLELTHEGIAFYPRAKAFLEHEASLFKNEKDSHAIMYSIGSVEIFLMPLCKYLKASSILTSLMTLLDLDPGQLEKLIANHQLDYAITYVPFPMADIDIIEIGKYRLGCYHLKGKFKDQELNDIPFVVPARGLSYNHLGIKERDGWMETIDQRNKKYSVNLLSTALELTLQGLCAIYIPDFIADKINHSSQANKKLVEYPLPAKRKQIQRAYLIKHKDRMEDAVFNELFDMMKAIIHKN